MGKRSIWSRLLAVVLALSMICSTQTMSVFADVLALQQVPANGTESTEPAGELEALTDRLNDTAGSTNLNSFLKDAVFDVENDGTVTVSKYSAYNIKLTFAENPTSQFDTDQTLVYTFPDAFVPVAQSNVPLPLRVTNSNGQTHEVAASFSVEGQQLKVNINTDDPNYELLKKAANVTFSVDLSAKVSETAQSGTVHFGDQVDKTVQVTEEHDLSVAKNGWYDKANGKIHYTITVRSTGYNENVTIADEIKGTLLKLEGDVSVSSSKGADAVDGDFTSKSDKGFTYVERAMEDGETLTLNYTASIDYSQLAGNKFTYDETNNTVKVRSDGSDEKTDSEDFQNQIAYDLITKSGQATDTSDVKNQIVTWTINLNPDCKKAMAGQTVTDTIADGASRDIMKYTGSGITVVRYDKNGTSAGEVTIPWTELGVNTDRAYTWSWTIPESDTTPYKYVITYQTVVDGTNVTSGGATVSNGASFDGESSGGSAGITPGKDFTVDKTHTAADGNERWIDWKVMVTVPADGYNEEFTVTDDLPVSWNNGNAVRHQLVEDTLNVDGLQTGESYTWDYTKNNWESVNKGFKLTFYRDENTEGLQKSTNGEDRTLTITFRTTFPEAWNESTYHTNTATVTADGDSKSDSDSFGLTSTKIVKSISSQSTNDGLPVITYQVLVGNVSEETVEITDTFDTELFEYYEDWNSKHNGQSRTHGIGGGANNWDTWGTNDGTAKAEVTDTGIKFSCNLQKDSASGEYYNWYGFRYSLKVKDKAALDKIREEAMANGGSAVYRNTVSFNGGSSSADWTYTYSPIEKTMTEWPSENNNYKAKFSIVVNKDGATLNNGADLELVDYMRNLQYVYNSMVVKIDGEIQTGYPFTLGKTDDGLDTITWKVPDGKKIEISYEAKIQGTGTVTYSNTADLMGKYSSGTGEQKVTVSYSGAGSGSTYAVTLVKVDEDDAIKKLPGATFKLQTYKENNPTTTQPTGLDGIDTVTGEKKTYYPTYTTGKDGEVTIASNQDANGWALWAGYLYCLTETKAPDNYEASAGEIWFYIPDGPGIPAYVSTAVAAGTCFIVNSSSDQITIKNKMKDSYEASGSLILGGTKNLTGRNITDGEFTFRLTAVDAQGAALTGGAAYTDTATNTGGTFTFQPITFTENDTIHDATENGGKHYYLIIEDGLSTSKDGLAANNQQFLVEVQVTDNKAGTLTPAVTSIKSRDSEEDSWTEVWSESSGGSVNEAIAFENTYTSTGSDTIYVTKNTVNGPRRDVTFGIYTDENCTRPAAADTTQDSTVIEGRVDKNELSIVRSSDSASADVSAQVRFTQEDITDKVNGTGQVVLYLKEKNASAGDPLLNDTAIYKYTYGLKDDGKGGITVTREVEVKRNGDNGWQSYSATDNAQYQNEDKSKGEIQFSAKKILTGTSFKAGDFIFKLLAEDLSEIETKTVGAGSAVVGQANTYEAEVTFSKIEYTMEDLAIKGQDGQITGYESNRTFTYYIEEDTTTVPTGYTYSRARYKVEVTVTDKRNGELEVTQEITQVKDDKGNMSDTVVNQAVFHNEFNVSGGVTLKATKTLQGQTLENEQFTFELQDVTEWLNEEEKLPDQTAQNDASGSVSFVLHNKNNNTQIYDQDDVGKTFIYEITETNTEANGYTYSEAVYRAAVTVSLVDGKITTNVAYTRKTVENGEEAWKNVDAGNVVFANSYAASGSTTICGTKEVTYRNAAVAEDEFTFLLEEKLGDTYTKVAEIKTQAGGVFTYTFNYEITDQTSAEDLEALLGTHTYKLTEKPGNDANMDYSGQEYTIVITVDDNDRDGELNVSDPVITEKTAGGVNAITFTNTYKAIGQAVLNITKNLTGNRAEGIGANEFGFTATEVTLEGDQEVTVEGGQKKTSQMNPATKDDPYTAEGTITLTYDQTDLNENGTAKTYWYKITENDVASAGVTKNDAVYYAKVTVSDKGDNMLETAVGYYDGIDGNVITDDDNQAVDGVTFTNEYTAAGSDHLFGKKTVEGGPMRDFTFGIYTDEAVTQLAVDDTTAGAGKGRVASNQVSVQEDQNSTNTAFSFTVRFTEADITEKGTGQVILYVKEEKAAAGNATTNDITLYRVTYSLTDDGEGKITATPKVERQVTAEEGQEPTWVAVTTGGVTFNNTYNAAGSVDLGAKKVMTGRNFGADEFSFELLASDETTVLQTKQAGAGTEVEGQEGDISYQAEVKFDAIEYTMADLAIKDASDKVTGYKSSETFIYYIVEVQPEQVQTGYTYSRAKYRVDVTVADNGAGTLNVTKTITQLLNDAGGSAGDVTGTPVETAVFNNRFETSGGVTLTAGKTLQGQSLADNQFTFTLTDVTEGLREEDRLPHQEAANVGGTVTFALKDGQGSTAIYDQDDVNKTFTYEMREKKPEGQTPGYTYSDAVYRAAVAVSLDEDTNKIKTAVTYTRRKVENGTATWENVTAEEVVFANAYAASGSTTISGTKEVTYRTADVEKDEFTFLLEEVLTDNSTKKIAEIKTQAGGDFSYEFKYAITENMTADDLKALLGTHTYKLTEKPGNDANMDYSGQEYTIVITVDDNDRDGELNVSEPVVTEASASGTPVNKDQITFTNTYKADGQAVLNITKKLTGNRAEAIGENEFTFTAAEVEMKDGAIVLVQDGQTADSQMEEAGADDPYTAAGTITLSYDETDVAEDGGEKTYWYQITENTVASAGVTKDDAVYYAKVTVSDGGNHTLATTVGYYDSIDGNELTGVTFTNRYEAAGTGEISGNKKLTGNRKDGIQNGEFTFEVVNTDTNQVVGRAAIASSDQAVNGTYSQSFTITFGKDVKDGAVVPFTQDDISETAYTNYALREAIPGEGAANASIDYDETTYPLSVTVSDSTTEKGKLVITVTRGDGEAETPEFVNRYVAAGTGEISGTKELTGNRLNTGAVEEGEFTFQVLDVNGTVVGEAANDREGRFTVTVNKSSQTNDDGTTYQPFTQDDIDRTYTDYKLVEKDNGDTESTGVTYDDKEYPLTISVTDGDGQGNLNVQVTLQGDDETVVFTNDYHAEGQGAIELNKSLIGRPTALRDKEFTFNIYELIVPEEGGDAQRVPVTVDGQPLTAANDGDGRIVFSLSYTQADQSEHTYVITEVNTGDPNIIYDEKEITVTVTVTDDGDGSMTVTTGYPEGDGSTTFTNRYTATGKVAFSGWKYVLGGRAGQVQEDEFTFTVKEQISGENGVTTEEVVATGRTLEGGQIVFTEIEYNQDDRNDPDDPDDVHTYLIYEDQGDDTSITYETEPVPVTVKVTDAVDPETGEPVEGKLDVLVTYPEKDQDAAGVTFENQYLAQGEITLEGTKELLGNRSKELADGEFTFEVRELDENNEPGETAVAAGVSKADGTIAFDSIEYKVEEGRSDIGTHRYVISEVAGDDEAVDYTRRTFTVTVEVTDLGGGKLDARVVETESETAAFENQYLAKGGLVLNFSKELTGDGLRDGQFTFQLADQDGNVLQTVTNRADGTIPFEALAYDQDDIGQEFVYSITEVNTGINGVTYDEAVYTLRVSVADGPDSDGTLAITPTLLRGDSVVEPDQGQNDAGQGGQTEDDASQGGQTQNDPSQGGQEAGSQGQNVQAPAAVFQNSFEGSVTLTKQGADGRILAGAQFALYAAAEGQEEYQLYATKQNPQGLYVTDENGQLRVTNLPANDYYFVETQAPQGYTVETDENGEPVRYSFSIGVEGAAANAVVNASLTVTNSLATTGSIQVTKRVSALDDDLNYVDYTSIHETYYVGIFADAAGTQPYGTDYIRSITMDGVAVSDPVIFDGLTSGTYYILETDEQGRPIPMNESQTMNESTFYCIVEEGGTNEVTLDLTADETPGTVRLQNVYLEFSDDYYWEATLDITKRVLKNGEEATVDDTFYAGVYQQLEDGSYELLVEVELAQNGTVTVTGLGGPVDGSVTYYVFETDGQGNRVSDDPAYGYTVSGEGSVTMTEENTSGAITITNSFEETETETTTTTKDSGKSTGSSTKSIKTGDTTNVIPYVLMMAAALAVIAGILYRKRRRGRA